MFQHNNIIKIMFNCSSHLLFHVYISESITLSIYRNIAIKIGQHIDMMKHDIAAALICSVLARNLFKGVHDEIHNIKKPLKPRLLKYFKWLLSHQRQRAHLFSNQYTNDTLEAQKK